MRRFGYAAYPEGRRAASLPPYSALLPVGFTKPAGSPLPLVVSYTTVSPFPLAGWFAFCCTFRRVAPPLVAQGTVPYEVRTFLHPAIKGTAVARPTQAHCTPAATGSNRPVAAIWPGEHEPVLRRVLKPELPVQPMGVRSAEHDQAQVAYTRSFHDSPDEHFGNPATSVSLVHPDVAEPCEGRKIGHHTTEAHLLTGKVGPKAQRVFYRTVYKFS